MNLGWISQTSLNNYFTLRRVGGLGGGGVGASDSSKWVGCWGVRGDFYFYFFHFWFAWWVCRSTNEYKIKIMYVNYIIMKIYVLI